MDKFCTGPVLDAPGIVNILRKYDDILLAAHTHADGDAIGSTMAMGFLLKHLGKRVALYNVDGLPPFLSWLSLPEQIYSSLGKIPFKPQLIVSLDCSEICRLGEELAEVFAAYPSLNIDHHQGNANFGSLGNFVCPDAAATGELVAEVADAANVPLIGGLAEGIYLSLVCDTGSFSFDNTSPKTLELAARLIRLGLDASALRASLDSQLSLAKIRLWSRLFLYGVRLECAGKIVLCLVKKEDFAAVGAQKDDLEGFVEKLRCLCGVRVAILVREDDTETFKVSLRSRGNDNVRQIAAALGGGGHNNAAAATVYATADETVERVLSLACNII